MDMNLYDEMIFDLHTKHKIGLNGVDVKCWKDIKKYIDDKNVLLEMIEQITNTLNVSVGGESYLKDVLKDKEKLIEELKLDLERANGYVDDVNENLAELVEYRVSESMGDDYEFVDEKSEIGMLRNDYMCLEKEKEELEKKVEDWERMMNLKTERMRDISEEDWVNGRY